MNLLIPYVNLIGHEDPLFNEYTYGDCSNRAKKLKNDIKLDYFLVLIIVKFQR